MNKKDYMLLEYLCEKYGADIIEEGLFKKLGPTLAAGALMLLVIFDPLREILTFLQTISDKANIDTVYIGIVLKILGIAYIASFASNLCKDAKVDSLATQIDFAGKIMILVLAIPILMAVLNSILQIM